MLRDADNVAAAKPGVTNCLKCGKKFTSSDKRRFRICPACTVVNNSVRSPRVISLKALDTPGVPDRDI
jgi:Zn finger protein HypA/HybF involved in hydrogenase expression